MTLATIERGPEQESDDLVVFLHGFGGCAAQWRGLQRDVARNAATMAIDLPGHAGSLDSGVKPSPKAMAEAINALLAPRRERTHVVGHSMGGAVASLMAILAPEQHTSLTLLAPGGFGEGINHEALTRWAAATTEAEITACLPSFFAQGNHIDPRIAPMHAELRAVEGRTASLMAIAERLATGGRQGTLPLDALFATPVAVDVVWGADDAILPVEQAVALAPRAASGRVGLHILPDVGHSPAEEAPDLVRALIAARLRRPA